MALRETCTQKGLFWHFMIACGRLLSCYDSDVPRVQATAPRSNDEGWKWKCVPIHHATDLLCYNLCGQLVNNSLFCTVLQWTAALLTCSKQNINVHSELEIFFSLCFLSSTQGKKNIYSIIQNSESNFWILYFLFLLTNFISFVMNSFEQSIPDAHCKK